MKKLHEINVEDFKEGILQCLGKGLEHYAPLGSCGNNYYIYKEKRTERVSRIRVVSLRLYNRDVELLITDEHGEFLFYGRYHLCKGIDFIANEYFRMFEKLYLQIMCGAGSREIKPESDTKFRKAYLVIPHWCDDQDPEKLKEEYPNTAIYAASSSKARYIQFLNCEDESKDWYKYRALRWKEKDLFPPELHSIAKDLPESLLQIIKHTYGVESEVPGCRNYFNGSEEDQDLITLVRIGLMFRNSGSDKMLGKGSTYYHLTNLGIRVAMSTRERLREDL